MINNIIHTLESTKNNDRKIYPIFSKEGFGYSKGIIFFKNEVCLLQKPFLSKILHYFENLSSEFDVRLLNAYIVTGNMIAEHQLYQKNYEQIRHYAFWNYTRESVPSRNVQLILRSVPDCMEILGGGELVLRKLSPKDVFEKWLASKPIKIDQDLYGTFSTFEKKTILLINGFYPIQEEEHTHPNSRIILFIFESKKNFSVLKQKFQGAVDSYNSHPHSLRHYIQSVFSTAGIVQFSLSRNGIHMSSSRDEGEREVHIFNKAIHNSEA